MAFIRVEAGVRMREDARGTRWRERLPREDGVPTIRNGVRSLEGGVRMHEDARCTGRRRRSSDGRRRASKEPDALALLAPTDDQPVGLPSETTPPRRRAPHA